MSELFILEVLRLKMSGPKLTAVEIEAMRRQRIADQRHRNETIIRAAVNDIRTKAGRARKVASHLGRYQKKALVNLSQIEERYIEAIMVSATAGYPEEPGQAERFNDRLSARTRTEIGNFDQELDVITKGWKRDIDGAAHLQRIGDISASIAATSDATPQISLSASMIAELLDDYALSISQLKRLEAESYISTLESAADKVADLQYLVLSSGVPAVKKAILIRVADSIQRALTQFQSDASMEPLLASALRSADTEIISVRRLDRERKTLYDECRLLAAQVSELTGFERQIPRIDQIVTKEALNKLATELKEEARCATENAYVAHAIDEVMRRRGYAVQKSVQLLSMTTQDHRLYMDGHSDVGIHAYQGSNGTVMMETASFSSSIRYGDDFQTVERSVPESTYERARLVEQQSRFCLLFPEIVADLERFGIRIQMKNDMPPSEATSVVFDTAESTVQGSSNDTSSVMRRRKRRTQREGGQREAR